MLVFLLCPISSLACLPLPCQTPARGHAVSPLVRPAPAHGRVTVDGARCGAGGRGGGAWRWGAGEHFGGLRPALWFRSGAWGGLRCVVRGRTFFFPGNWPWWAQPRPQVQPQPRCAQYRGTGGGASARSPHSRARRTHREWWRPWPACW